MGTILVPFDGSEAAKKALQKASELVKPEDRLIVIHVIPTMTEFAQLDPGLTMKKAQDMINTSLEPLKSRGIDVTGTVKYGEIVEEILKAAGAEKATLIVIGSTGRSTEKIGRFLLGSVADKVARHAACGVLIVR